MRSHNSLTSLQLSISSKKKKDRSEAAWFRQLAAVCMLRVRFLKGRGVSSWLTEEPAGIPEIPLVENLVFSDTSAV